jgi:ABC-2 type transport system permease protein
MSRGLRPLSLAMLRGFIRDRTAVFFTVLFPLMFLVLFGGLFKDSGAPKADIIEIGPVAVFDQMPAESRAGLADVATFTRSTDAAAALEQVRKGDADAAVEQRGENVIVHYSAADQVSAGYVLGLVNSIVERANLAATGQPPRFTVESAQVEDESLKTIQYITPGLLGWAIATGATFSAALTLVDWRKKRILRRLRLAPIKTADVVGARVGTTLLIAIGQTAIFLGIAVLPYFGLKLADYWWMSIPLIICGTLAFLSLGLLIGSLTNTVEAAAAAANLIVLPMAFLSGAFFPLDGAPGWLQTLSHLLPLGYLREGMMDVMVRGDGPLSVLPSMAALLAFGAVVALIASRFFRWDAI